MKKYFAILLIVLIVLAGCSGNKSSGDNDTSKSAPDEGEKTNEAKQTGTVNNENSDKGDSQTTDKQVPNPAGLPQAQEVVIPIKAMGPSTGAWEFSPSEIRVRQGQLVKLLITVPENDVAHGFALPDFGVNQKLEPGITTTIEFVADKKGEFNFRCSVPCGSGHSGMKGKVIVE